MSDKFAYFKSVKAKSVAIMGGNNKHVFYLEKPTKVTDPGDIYIFRKKTEKVIETDQYGQPLDPNANDFVQTEQGVVRRRSAPPRSHITYNALDTAKRKQLEAEQRMKAQETEKSSKEEDDDEPEKQSIDDELSAEDDLNVDDEDFNFEKGDGKKNPKQSKKFKRKDSIKSKPKKTKIKSKSKSKDSSKKKEIKKKKATSSTKKKKSEKKSKKKKDIKSRLNTLRGFKT